MNLKKSIGCIVLSVLVPCILKAQESKLRTNLFVRTPQIVNYNFGQNEVAYSPVISIGTGFSLESKFIELATFISDSDTYGFYTFFGYTLKSKPLFDSVSLFTNWFGEVTYVPGQALESAYFMYTTGICYFLNHSFDWGSIGIPLCLGIAYSDQEISLNTRTILNLSINLN
ncbi:hypothetical protein [Poritiphilus flavus]|uniref:Uncharacterized protein n=1 Tax=Poritiphilus flavus TaxID=2697053 RepID=A0A6L9EE50_9FLAO|nr:hypothetical protein [Poritiphilus flavus]NAS13010.1 hypothetical protein [Poritiphilus flavus]